MKNNITKKCRWKTCDDVPCGKSMPQCTPKYCNSSRKNSLSSKSWGYCNIINNKTRKTKYMIDKCKEEMERFKSCKMAKSRSKDEIDVDINRLHNAMPYIWRFLRKGTRKEMVRLANLSPKELNIPFSLYSEKKPVQKNRLKRYKKLKKIYKDI